MTKQEEIREGVYNVIEDRVMTQTIHTSGQIDELITDIQKYEDSQGVVIEVERELPKVYDDEHPNGFSLPSWCTSAYKKAGYVAVEPLIEVSNGQHGS